MIKGFDDGLEIFLVEGLYVGMTGLGAVGPVSMELKPVDS
jgi:hypothetical protein